MPGLAQWPCLSTWTCLSTQQDRVRSSRYYRLIAGGFKVGAHTLNAEGDRWLVMLPAGLASSRLRKVGIFVKTLVVANAELGLLQKEWIWVRLIAKIDASRSHYDGSLYMLGDNKASPTEHVPVDDPAPEIGRGQSYPPKHKPRVDLKLLLLQQERMEEKARRCQS